MAVTALQVACLSPVVCGPLPEHTPVAVDESKGPLVVFEVWGVYQAPIAKHPNGLTPATLGDDFVRQVKPLYLAYSKRLFHDEQPSIMCDYLSCFRLRWWLQM